MKVFVKVKTEAKQEKVEKVDDSHFIVWVKERPEKGLANKAVLKALERFFEADAEMVSGFKSRQKIIKISKLL